MAVAVVVAAVVAVAVVRAKSVCNLPKAFPKSCGRPLEVFAGLPEVFRRSSGGLP